MDNVYNQSQRNNEQSTRKSKPRLDMGAVADKLYFSMREYVPPMSIDCVHQQYHNSHEFTNNIINDLKNHKCTKFFTYSGLRYIMPTVYPIDREKPASWIMMNKYKDYYNLESPTNWIYGFCHQCAKHLFIKTNGLQLITENIRSTISKLNESKKIQQQYFNALWMNISLILTFLLHPTFGLLCIVSYRAILYALSEFFKSTQKYMKICSKTKQIIWGNLEEDKCLTHPQYEAISVIIDFIFVFNQYLSLCIFDEMDHICYKQMHKSWSASSNILRNWINSQRNQTENNQLLMELSTRYSMLIMWLKPLEKAIIISQRKRIKKKLEDPQAVRMDQTMKRNLRNMIQKKHCGWHTCHTIRGTRKHRKWYKCKGCKLISYCSKRCQKYDWNTAYHKEYCPMFLKYS